MKTVNEAFLETLELFGLKEVTGDKDNPTILEFYKSLGHGWVSHDEVAWCAALIGSKLQKYDYQIPPLKNRLAARAYLSVNQQVDEPVVGWDYVVFERGNNGFSGHVAWFLGFEGDNVKVLGGNQSNQINIALYPRNKVLGYVRPININA